MSQEKIDQLRANVEKLIAAMDGLKKENTRLRKAADGARKDAANPAFTPERISAVIRENETLKKKHLALIGKVRNLIEKLEKKVEAE